MTVIRVLLVDDHTLFRQSLEQVIEAEPDIEIVGGARTSAEALELLDTQRPDLALVDVQLEQEDGLALAQEIRKHYASVGVIMLTMHRENQVVERATAIGVDGYALKEDAIEDLVYAIRSVNRGGRYLSPTLLRDEAPGSSQDTAQALRGESNRTELTDRQREVLLLVAEGATNREIAKRLFISQKTVENHRTNIAQQYGLHRAVDYVRYAIRRGWMQA